jgi:hypothetical protein
MSLSPNTSPPNSSLQVSSPTLENQEASPPPTRIHPMVTWSQNNILKPKPLPPNTILYPPPRPFVAQISVDNDVEPTSVIVAIKFPEWRQATNAEFDALLRNDTWNLVPYNSTINVIGCKWIFFCIKRHADGSIERYKARFINNLGWILVELTVLL